MHGSRNRDLASKTALSQKRTICFGYSGFEPTSSRTMFKSNTKPTAGATYLSHGFGGARRVLAPVREYGLIREMERRRLEDSKRGSQKVRVYIREKRIRRDSYRRLEKITYD